MVIRKLNKLPKDFISFIRVSSGIAYRLNMKVYLVGGIVRDLIIGRESFDYDIVVEGDGIEFSMKIARKFNSNFRKHHRFGTATVYYRNYKIDIATCRREYYPHRGALPRVSRASLGEDLLRRDFTINAMALSLNKTDYGRLIDPYGGYIDLKNGIIRIMHDDSFFDDPTRILRAIRFEKRFSFRIEKHTLALLKMAVSKKALSSVDDQRLRDELILILKEPSPLKYIKRIQELTGLSFISKGLRVNKDDYYIFARIEKAIELYKNKFSTYRRIEEWIIYLMALLSKLPRNDVIRFCKSFRLRRGEEKRLVDYFEHRKAARYLNRNNIKISRVYFLLYRLSFETIIFLYASSRNKTARDNILFFLNKLTDVRLSINGHDLARLGFAPKKLYSKVFDGLKMAKLDKGLVTKNDEIAEAKKIFRRLKK
ncbi:MAG: hypothetical protein B1H08_03150 [Candidatus Omnitrophica bacterium 4484_171]|nr:MAG: hypothetical protein B1H08_03150 [Candidatus Omnitrophica bacterium 4484_171]